jgi:hypothetical protein
MTAYAVLPDAVVEDEAELARLLASAYRMAAATPPKVKKPKRARAKTPSD